MKLKALLVIPLALSGCISPQKFSEVPTPDAWETRASTVTTSELASWWTSFNDPVLNGLVETALTNSPQQRIAAARIEEARGIRRTARSRLFPQLGLSAQVRREREGFTKSSGDSYDAEFDASYEIDLFGKNRNTVDAANAQLRALKAEFQNVEITLAGEVVRTYIDYRAAEKQRAISENNLETQEGTLKLIQQQRDFGETPQLDVERSESLVNTTRASIPEFKRFAGNARLQLAVLTGQLPQEMPPLPSDGLKIPGADIAPLMLAPADVMANRPDIRRATALLEANTALTKVATAELYPTVSLSGFYGVAEGVLFDSTTIWRGLIGGAVNLIDFGRIEGIIDVAQAREIQAYEQYRQTILQAVAEVESAMVDHAHISEQRGALQKALDNSSAAMTLSEELYREGEISFLDVLVAQRTVNNADSALASAEAAQAQSIVRLYKSLGVY
jgi:NodT family efflux transporter outer membrane factor (OMF) lipoprotein